MLLAVGICSVSALIIAQYWTHILDIVLPINEFQPFHMQIMTEYFINQQKYFSLILLHITAAYCIGLATIIATGTILIAYVQHFCGMFRIARYEANIEMAKNSHIIKTLYYLINK